MRATNIRIAGKKPTREELAHVADMLRGAYLLAGYVTDVEIRGAALTISSGMGQFRVDTDRLGYNARLPRDSWHGFGGQGNTIRGYARTDVPTWEQRVEFNNLTNGVLDALNVSATIRSGPFTVRSARDGAVTSWDRYAYPAAMDIVPLTAEMIAEGDEAMRAHRRAQRAARKAAQTAVQHAPAIAFGALRLVGGAQ